MPPQHTQSERPAGRRQPYSFIRRVGHQIALAERLEHARDGAGRDAKRRGQLPGRRQAVSLARADLMDRLDVVLNGEAWHDNALRVFQYVFSRPVNWQPTSNWPG